MIGSANGQQLRAQLGGIVCNVGAKAGAAWTVRHGVSLSFVIVVMASTGCLPAGADDHSPTVESSAEEWLFPGEYESHQGMWMLWPTFEYKAGFPSTEPMSDMIRAMSGHTHVNLAVQDAADEAAARSLLTADGVPLGHVPLLSSRARRHLGSRHGASVHAQPLGQPAHQRLELQHVGSGRARQRRRARSSEAFDRTVAS